MRYLATIMLPDGNRTKAFPTILLAEQWLDSLNNNYQYTSLISELNEFSQVVDGFYYTVGR